MFLVWLVLRAYAATRPRCDVNNGQITRYFLTGDKRKIREALARGETGPPGRYLHHIHAADIDTRGLHNHPWEFLNSRILLGWYRERSRYLDGGAVSIGYGPGDVNMLTEAVFHRITAVSPGGAWTLCNAGPKHGRGWGFQ